MIRHAGAARRSASISAARRALVPPGDVDALAAAFARWAADPAALDCAKRTAWQAAVRRWHWEHDANAARSTGSSQEALS